METNFYNDDFESLLKKNADAFKLHPSKKVWRGIYNDLHPGKRWPSFAMGIFFIFTLVIIGHLDTQQLHHLNMASLSNQNKSAVAITNKENSASPQVNKNTKTQIITNQTLGSNIFNKQTNSSQAQPEDNSSTNFNSLTNTVQTETVLVDDNPGKKSDDINLQKTKLANENSFDNDKEGSIRISHTLNTIALTNDKSEFNLRKKSSQVINEKSHTITVNAAANPDTKKNVTVNNNFFKNLRHKSDKIKWAYYLTPSVSYRIIRNDNAAPVTSTSIVVVTSPYNNISNYVNQKPSPGFEVGTVMKYLITKKLSFNSGIQLNYSSYKSYANNIHPVLASLTLNSAVAGRYSVNDISFYANSSGSSPTTLHNYSIQGSIPVGLEYVVAGKNYIHISAAANIQPSYIIANRSYLISSDKRNYLTQPSLLRNFNMSSSAGLFVTFKSKSLDLQVGPQVRYQLFSTYRSEYPVSEHLIDYGIRFSVSKTIR